MWFVLHGCGVWTWAGRARTTIRSHSKHSNKRFTAESSCGKTAKKQTGSFERLSSIVETDDLHKRNLVWWRSERQYLVAVKKLLNSAEAIFNNEHFRVEIAKWVSKQKHQNISFENFEDVLLLLRNTRCFSILGKHRAGLDFLKKKQKLRCDCPRII